jgi:hypothetical protein
MKSVAEIVGPWVDPNFESGLIRRCRESWNVPIDQLTNKMLATFLRQNIATEAILEEANKRLANGFDDQSEICEGELHDAVQTAMQPSTENGTD